MKNYLGNYRNYTINTGYRNVDCQVNVSIISDVENNSFEMKCFSDANGNVVIEDVDEIAKCYFDFSNGITGKKVTFQFIVLVGYSVVKAESLELYYSMGEISEEKERKCMERAGSPEVPKSKRNVAMFKFIGEIGTMEEIYFYGKREREGDFNATYVQAGQNYRKVHTDFSVKYKQYTGAISAEKRDLVYVMAKSPNVWVVENGSAVEVTIIDVDIAESEPHEQPIGLAITYRYANVNKM